MSLKAITGSMILTGAATRSDGSLTLRFCTGEISADEKAALMELQNRNLKVLIQPQDEAPTGIKEIRGEFSRQSPSQRIRSILFCLWKYETEQERTSLSFEDFYLRRTNAIAEELKKQLPGIP